MKKVLILLTLLLLTGCGNKEMKCTVTTIGDKYTYEATYKIEYKGKYVEKITKNEKYSTNDKDKYNYLRNYRELELDHMDATYGGYSYKMKFDKHTIDIKTTINAKKLNADKLVDDNLISKYYVEKNKLLVSGLKKYYESKNATCK